MIDWSSSKTHWMLLPKMKAWDQSATEDARNRTRWITHHIWIASSGTTRKEGLKWVGLHKDAFLSAAESLNRHVHAIRKDVWLNVLPTYHVSGLTMFSRAHVAGGRVIDLSRQKWNAKRMLEVANEEQVSFVSLVPTQLFDLVKTGEPAPKKLKAAFLGGGALDEELYQKAHALQWPILTCYGMTETCAQVATSRLEDVKSPTKPKMKILSHADIEVRDGRLAIQASSLADFIVQLHPEKGFSLEDPRRGGWFLTEDLGEVKNGFVSVLGRTNDRVKVLGELVSLVRIEEELKRFVKEAFCVLSIPDSRKGSSLIAVFENPASLKDLAKNVARYHAEVSSLWHLDHWYAMSELPRSALGKILKAQVLSAIGL